jgi:hypothetical protein
MEYDVANLRHAACVGQMRNAYKILVGKSERRRPVGRPKHRLDENERICGEYGGKLWNGFICPRIWTSGEIL